jgi:hypothetical protein
LPSDLAPFHIVISDNVSNDNMETSAVSYPHTDGNGIIIDDWLDTQDQFPQPYPYQGLIQANLIYDNGGRGIQRANLNFLIYAGHC